MDNDVTLKPATDPNAPKGFDLAFAQKLVRTARNLLRSPSGEIIQSYASQLDFAITALSGVAEKVNAADNNVTRYQRESENANTEVTKMQRELTEAREREAAMNAKLDAANAELESLRPKPKKKKEASEPRSEVRSVPLLEAQKKRGRPAKIVPISQAQ